MQATKFLLIIALLTSAVGCQPTVKLEAPEKPILVNMNVEISVKTDKDIEKTIKNNPDIF